MIGPRKNVPEMATAKVELSGSDWQLRMTVSVPKGPMALQELLPLVRTVDEAVVNTTIKSVEESGRKISCKKGCGACCRQLVAISVVEAQSLAELVASMPPERQAVIRARFDQAVARLEEAGLLGRDDPKGDRAPVASDCGSRAASLQELSRRYFRLQVSCPFLEDEACSIYTDRPLICREYHVTSPAARCAKLFEEPVDRVELPIRLGDIVTLATQKINEAPAHAIPLVLALEWSEAHGESLMRRHDGAQMFQILIGEMTRACDESRGQQPRGTKVKNGSGCEALPEPAAMVAKSRDATSNNTAEIQTARIEISGPDWKFRTTVSVPGDAMEVRELLPLARTVADTVVDGAIESIEEHGEKISCKKSCGACCRQLVPIPQVEARHIRDLVNGLPEPRRTEIRRRFAEARQRLEQSGLLEKLVHRDQWGEDEVQPLGLKYFFQGIPCPFLEEESCSIYADRPITCREYMVTSPAENCARPSEETLKQVTLPFKTWPALSRFDKVPPSARFVPWVPLILAPEWADAHPDKPRPRPGMELLRELFENLSTTKGQQTARAQVPFDEPRSFDFGATVEEIAPSRDTAGLCSDPFPSPIVSSNPEALPDQEFPLRLGSDEDFARVESMFQTAAFDEGTVCRKFDIGDMSDINSVDMGRADRSDLLGLLMRLFLFQERIPRVEVERLVTPPALSSLSALDLIRIGMAGSENKDGIGTFYSPVWLYPVGSFLIASDRGKNPDGSPLRRLPDVVFPAIYEGTLRFLRVISNSPAADALDLCSGSGIAALALSKTAKRVVACDITARAVHFAKFNRLLNGCSNVEVVQGDLYDAVKGQKFDRIVAHPPFVPSSTLALIYRDSGETGEALIKRIIAGLPEYLRPGGTFLCVCAAWDTKENTFEERVRSWLGDGHHEFDVLFALHRQASPVEIAERLPEVKDSNDASEKGRWEALFRKAGLETNVYGAIVIHRRALASDESGVRQPITRRLRLGTLTDGSCFDWAMRWYSWRQRKEGDGQLLASIRAIKPRLSAYLQAKVTHAVHRGFLAPSDVVFEVERPFPTRSRVDLWMMHMLADFNGQRTPEEVYETARRTLPVPESFGLNDFATLVANMIERGCLEVENHLLEN